jgi:CubicO group peptidase (beta-lactamase class C family)
MLSLFQSKGESMQQRLFHLFLSLILIFTFFAPTLPQVGYAQTTTQTQVSSDLQKSLQTIEEKVEKRRTELGIPGMSLVIVKDDQIIYLKGLGYKDFENKIAVTPDTQFAIGSATKAFTALSVLMSADEGKISLDDSPKKYLSYFKMQDPETDKNITVRDLMAHTSGLNRTDLAMITGKLNRQELIQVAGEAKPMAKLREKFFYQNIMFAAAGEIVATVQKKTWEKFVPERIFALLGMTNSTMTVKEMQKAKDYSFGYSYNFDTKETRKLPTREIGPVSPAGSINSSARDMANWLRFVMNGGTVNGKRLVSEKGFEEWLKPQINVVPGGKMAYGLGWFLQEWNGLKVVQHGGNIDGFNAMVAMIPEKKLGFVMLTNVSASSLGSELMPIVWEGILGKPETPKTNNSTTLAPEKEAGKYRFEAAGFDIEVKMQDGKLVAVVPGQPVYELQNVGGRKYKLANAPGGFFVTFKDDSMYLEQPQGNYTLPKIGAKTTTKNTDSAKELVGKYESETAKGRFVEIKDEGGKVTLNVEGQQPYTLNEKEKDKFGLSPLPDDFMLKVKRNAGGQVEGISLAQPQGEFNFKPVDAKTVADAKPKITVEELMGKTIVALGGEANWRKLNSRVTKYDLLLEHQGLKGSGTSYEKAPNLSATEAVITAFGKNIATIFEYFDGTNGGESISFAPAETYTGQRLEDVKYENDFYGLLDWNKNLKSAEVKATEKVGEEECYVVEFQPEKASRFTYYISTKTFLPLKKNSVVTSSTSDVKTPITETFSDYRQVDGVLIPFKTVNSNPSMGDIVTIIKEVKHNVQIADTMFRSKTVK